MSELGQDVFLPLGAIAVDEKVFKSAEQWQSPTAAFVHDARRHFGWKSEAGPR